MLARCLDALIAGTLAPAEIVVVDQSEDGGSERLVEERRQLFPRLVWIRGERRGLSAARNAGSRAASASVVAFTDDDCVPDTGWVEALSSAFAADERLAAVTGPMLPLPSEAVGAVPVSSRTSRERQEFVGRALPWAVGTGGNTSVRREWLERVGGFDERLGVGTPARAGEDLDLFRRLLGAGGRIVYDPEASCQHEQKTPAERRARRAAYGKGAGAALGRWVRDGDLRALVPVARWFSLRIRLALRGSGVGDELRVLAGTLHGLVHGVMLPGWIAGGTRAPAEAVE